MLNGVSPFGSLGRQDCLQNHGGAGLEPHHGAASGYTGVSEVGRYAAGYTLFLQRMMVEDLPFCHLVDVGYEYRISAMIK